MRRPDRGVARRPLLHGLLDTMMSTHDLAVQFALRDRFERARAKVRIFWPADPDARLLAAVNDFHAACEELVVLAELAGTDDIDPAALDAIDQKTDAAILVAADASARTCAGLRAKAEMVQVQLPKELDGGWSPGDAAASRLLISFCQDVLRMVPEPPR